MLPIYLLHNFMGWMEFLVVAFPLRERAYFYNTHRFDLGGKWNVAKPLGGSTRWGHMTGGLTNHLSDLNPYINSCGLGLVVFGLLSV